ncbi:hypothetical protein OIV83_000765 [Microbotryomycetes sp. JL201]|nr:hypothetical protein OIV83_000765 [Microbotryomycetes sp. JL201]
MQVLRKTAAAVALSRPACVACATPSTSRKLATVADLPYGASPSAAPVRAKAKARQHRFVVPAPPTEPQPKAPRYSKNSSRVKGRSPNRPRKMLSPTELDPAGVAGQPLPSTQGEIKIYLPSVFMRLVRNTDKYKDDPYTATFRTDLRLSKPDISNYLKNIYGLDITSLRTMNYLSKLKRNNIGGGMSRSSGTKNYKKVLVGLKEPFWYPEERSREWCNEHFERDRMEEMRDRKMLKIGDGRKHGVSAQRYRGAHKSKAEVERLAKIVEEGGADLTKTDGAPSDLKRPMGLRMRKNVIRSRAERQSDYQTKIEQEMERLRLDGHDRFIAGLVSLLIVTVLAHETPPPRHERSFHAQSTPFRRSWVDLMQQLNELFQSYARQHDSLKTAQPDSANSTHGNDEELRAPLSALPELIDAFERRRKVELLTSEEKLKVREFAASGPPDISITIDDFVVLLQNVGAASVAESVLPNSPSPHKSSLRLSLFTPGKDKASIDSTSSPLDHKRPVSAQELTRLTLGPEPPTPTRLTKKRSLLSLLSASPRSASATPQDVSELLISRGDLYLGVPLEGPLGQLDAEAEANKLKTALRGPKDKDLAATLADKTFAQIREIDRAFQRQYDKTLLQAIQAEKSLKGNLEFAMRGFVMGPLDFDVFLLRKALDGSSRNDSVLIDLLVARRPATVALLRAAYRSTVHDDASVSARCKTLEGALLAQSGANAKLKRAWELVLQARWTDVQREGDESPPDEEKLSRLLNEDPPYLGLRLINTSFDSVRILLSRSPEHLGHVMQEFRRGSATSITKAIKQVFHGTLLEMLLFAVENAKHKEDGLGVWRDAKRLSKTLDSTTSRNETLSWRIIRLHWDRERFVSIQQAFKQKFGKPLLERVTRETTGPLKEILRLTILASDRPLPLPTEADNDRLSAPRSLSRASSSASMEPPSSDNDRKSLLEGDGELSGPDVDSPAMLLDEQPLEPSSTTMQTTQSLDRMMERTAVKTHRTSSSMDYRRRSSPLDSNRSGSSLNSSTGQLKHVRPVAPGRRRLSSNKSEGTSRASSPSLARSPTPTGSMTDASFTSALNSSQGTGASTASVETPETAEKPSTMATAASQGPTSPLASIDSTAYHPPPISPSRPSLPLYSIDASPASVHSLLPFDLATPASSFSLDTPDRSWAMRREGSTASQRSFTSSGAGSSRLSIGENGINYGSPGQGRDGETFQSLLRHASELAKKLKDTEVRLDASSTAFEREQAELESRLEDARAELQSRRREEKDLRINEKQHLNQIMSLEADVARLQKSLDKSKESYETMKNNYSAQCEEAEKLRALVAETRREFQAAEDAAQAAGLHSQQLEREKELLEKAIAKLEQDLSIALRVQDALSDQKQENLLLKETIDRLRFDLDEMRTKGRKSGFLDPAALSAGHPAETPSMSKSLGKEIARKLAADGSDEDEVHSGSETEGEDAEVDDIIVTTHRRIKKKKRAHSSEPTAKHIEHTVVVADAETQTDGVKTSEMVVQTDGLQLVKLAPASPRKAPRASSKTIAAQLGVELSALEDLVESSRQSQLAAARGRPQDSFGILQARRASRWATRFSSRAASQGPALLINVLPESAKPYLAQFVESSLTFFLYSTTLYLLGFISGAWVSPFQPASSVQSAFMPRELVAYAPSSLPLGAGIAREGMAAFLESIVWNGVATHRRLPT